MVGISAPRPVLSVERHKGIGRNLWIRRTRAQRGFLHMDACATGWLLVVSLHYSA